MQPRSLLSSLVFLVDQASLHVFERYKQFLLPLERWHPPLPCVWGLSMLNGLLRPQSFLPSSIFICLRSAFYLYSGRGQNFAIKQKLIIALLTHFCGSYFLQGLQNKTRFCKQLCNLQLEVEVSLFTWCLDSNLKTTLTLPYTKQTQVPRYECETEGYNPQL